MYWLNNMIPTFTTIGFSVLAVSFIIMAILGFSGRGASIFLGKEGTAKREIYKEKEYMRLHGWLGVVLFLICTFGILGIHREWASSALVFSAMLLPYLIIIVGYRYLSSSMRFRKDAQTPDRAMRAHGLSFLALLYALPMVLFFAALVNRYYTV